MLILYLNYNQISINTSIQTRISGICAKACFTLLLELILSIKRPHKLSAPRPIFIKYIM